MPHPPRLSPDYYLAHGLGNDYLVFEEVADATAPDEGAHHDGAPDATAPDESAPNQGAWLATVPAIQLVCDRWTGLGSDGIVVLCRGEEGEPFPLRMFNPDGSEFERSGNGLRILASHLRRTGRVGDEAFTVRSGGSEIGMRVHGVSPTGTHDVSVEMGRARTDPGSVELDTGQLDGTGLPHPSRGRIDFQPVSVGNPHAVVFLGDHSEETLADLGSFLASHPAFRRGTNVQLARVIAPGALRIAIWERGVGRTSASGTSSCAAAVAAVHRGYLAPGRIRVMMAGGELQVGVSAELDVTLRGPVQEVSTGRFTPGFLAGLSGRRADADPAPDPSGAHASGADAEEK
jgi:diaminopimelate epimerase